MIQCPKCKQSLPDWSQNCQFCGSDVKGVSRPAAAEKKKYAAFETPKWIWVCYYGIAIWWILGGIYDVLDSMYVFGKPVELLKLEKEFNTTVGPSIFGIVVGGLTALFGIGLAVKLELIRGIVNFFAGLRLIFGLLGLAGAIMGMTFSGVLGLSFVLINLADIVTAGLLIFIIGETDMKANI